MSLKQRKRQGKRLHRKEGFVTPEQAQRQTLQPIHGGRSNAAWSCPAVFLAALVLYSATANRGAQWQDSGHHILRVIDGQASNPLGLALSHPLHHWLGRLVVAADLLEPCFAITLISVFFGALAVGATYGCVFTLTRSRIASLLAAGSLAVAHTFWRMATVTETYTLAAALLALECWCLVSYSCDRRARYLWLICLFNGLGISNHLLALLTTPVVAIVVLLALKKKEVGVTQIAGALAMWLVGSSLYGGMVLTELIRSGDFQGTIHSALFGNAFAQNVLNITLSPRSLIVGAAFLLLNFPNLLLPAAVCGIMRASAAGVPTLARRALLVGLAVHVCFAARYDVIDQHIFFVPAYVLAAVFGGIGFASALQAWATRRRVFLTIATVLLVLTPALYVFVPATTRRLGILRPVAHNKPYRDDYVYVFTPWSVVERSADRLSLQAVDLAGTRGLIFVEDAMAEFAVRYRARREGLGDDQIERDVTTIRIEQAIAEGRPIVLVPLDRQSPKTAPGIGSWKRVDDLYVLSVEGADQPAQPAPSD